MGLLDSIVGTVTDALNQQSKTPTEGSSEGAQVILGSLLQQGGFGQSGGIIGDLLGGLTGGGGEKAEGGGALGGILQTLAASGLADQVASWIGNNANLPISVDQIRDALGSEQVQQMAEAAGLPIGDYLKQLSEHLPAAASEAAGAPSGGGGIMDGVPD